MREPEGTTRGCKDFADRILARILQTANNNIPEKISGTYGKPWWTQELTNAKHAHYRQRKRLKHIRKHRDRYTDEEIVREISLHRQRKIF